MTPQTRDTITEAGFPAYAAFTAGVDALNSFLDGRRVRRYQGRILRDGRFEVPSPLNGELVACEGCVIGTGALIGYRFGGDEPFWILAGEVHWGYPLLCVFFPHKGTPPYELIKLPTQFIEPATASKGLLAMEQLWSDRDRSDLEDVAGPVLLIGHPNFAHNLWNELSGLDKWASTATNEDVSRLHILATYQPFGPMGDFIPEIDMPVIAWHPSVQVLRKTLATRIGSTKITHQVRERLRNHALSTRAAAPASEDPRRKIWITARIDGRTCENQTEFLTTLMGRIEDEFPGNSFLIDGFSYAEDWESRSYDAIRSKLEHREKEITDYIDGLIAQTAAQAVNVSGLGLLETIAAMQGTSYYVAHAGTAQHKIAWLWNVPGYIHTCVAGLTPATRRWYADQLDGGIEPDLAPRQFVTDTTPSDVHNVQRRNVNYILSTDEVVSDIISCMRRRLATDEDVAETS